MPESLAPASSVAHRRYAIVSLAAIALLLPGTDPVTTALELIPMLVLYELSVLATSLLERKHGARSPSERAWEARTSWHRVRRVSRRRGPRGVRCRLIVEFVAYRRARSTTGHLAGMARAR